MADRERYNLFAIKGDLYVGSNPDDEMLKKKGLVYLGNGIAYRDKGMIEEGLERLVLWAEDLGSFLSDKLYKPFRPRKQTTS